MRGARGDFLQDPVPTQVLTGTCVIRGSSHDEAVRNAPLPFRMPSIRSLAVTLHRHLAPLTLGLTIGALCLYQGHREEKYKHRDYLEAFPFSHYPMYSDFDERDYYVYVTDRKDQPIVGLEILRGLKKTDGKEVWVANHVSDSVSVIDTDPSSPTHLQVIATVQDLDSATKATRFDEPVGIAFANNCLKQNTDLVVFTDEYGIAKHIDTPHIVTMKTKTGLILESTGGLTSALNVLLHCVASARKDQLKERLGAYRARVESLKLYRS